MLTWGLLMEMDVWESIRTLISVQNIVVTYTAEVSPGKMVIIRFLIYSLKGVLALTTLGCLMFRGQYTVKRALIVCVGEPACKKLLGTLYCFFPMERHPGEHFTMLQQQERNPRGHFTICCSLEGHPRKSFIMFFLPQGHPRGHFHCLFGNCTTSYEAVCI